MTDAKTLEGRLLDVENLHMLIFRHVHNAIKDGINRSMMDNVIWPSTKSAAQEIAEKFAAIQSLRASGTGEGELNADQMHELNTIAHNLEALSRVGFGHDINAVERHTLRKAAIIVRASGERGSSSSGLSGNTGINDPWLPIETAPKDGSRIVLWLPNVRYAVTAYWDSAGCWYVKHGAMVVDKPTHWRPEIAGPAPTPAARGLDRETIEACARLADWMADCEKKKIEEAEADKALSIGGLKDIKARAQSARSMAKGTALGIRSLAADGGVQSDDTGTVRSPSLSAGEEK